MNEWVQINPRRSWHIYAGWASRGGLSATLCGRFAKGQPQPDYPANEKTCELCLRSNARREENAMTEQKVTIEPVDEPEPADEVTTTTTTETTVEPNDDNEKEDDA